MILNVSGRTDIVAFYSTWFMNRYNEGFVDVRNPFYPKSVSRINFDDVDAILFCTKNPLPIIKHLKDIDKPIIFHITLTSYMKDIEPGVIDKNEIIEGIKEISEIIGNDNIFVRYDPVFISDKYSVDYHIMMFERMCNKLSGYVNSIIISFIDDYKNVRNNKETLKLKEFTSNDYKLIGTYFSSSAKKYGMTVQTCFEEENLSEYGFVNKACIDREYAMKVTGKNNFKKWKARDCGCVELVDIGVYNSCKHFCKYCYANYDEKLVRDNFNNHDVNSSLLVGNIMEDDIIKVRTK